MKIDIELDAKHPDPEIDLMRIAYGHGSLSPPSKEPSVIYVALPI
jgi:hypothetical protein